MTHTSSISEKTVNTSRLNFHYRQHGDDDGIPILLVHGTYATSRWWEPFMDVLPAAIFVVAVDLRGVGGTDRVETGYSIADQADDIAALIEAMGWRDFDMVAHSSGGAIAIEYVLTRPDMVRTLTLVDSVPIEGVHTPPEMYSLLEEFRSNRELLAQALHAMMPTVDLSDANKPMQTFFEQLVEDAQAMSPAAFVALADALNEWNRFGDSRSVRLPTLLLWGDQDIIIDRDAMTRTLIAIPGANSLEVLRSIGHSPMIEAPVALAERLIDFITDDFSEFDEVRRIATEEISENYTSNI